MGITQFQVRGCICLLHGKVKDKCAKVVKRFIKGLGETPAKISEIVEQQLLPYHYIFPSPKVNAAVFFHWDSK